ncbi:hypothetical protein [Paraburkholderia dilworthii]|uniref:hypothetical protein n=1 Tax=Paraburkholderia dilworthii TaxID=948106 RepID=UPI000425AB31|nr:hypothetical protein [Paraburkholderia dilworthii]
MLPQIAQILQDTLNFTRYAAAPFVVTGRPDSVRQWLHALRERLTALTARVDSAIDALSSDECTTNEWTDEETVQSHQWVRHHYPNESDKVQYALRAAWRDGQRQLAARSEPRFTGRERHLEGPALIALLEVVDESLGHADTGDRYESLYREAAVHLGKIRSALNIANDDTSATSGADPILEAIADLKIHK